MRLNTMITLGASAAFGLMAVVLARGWINGAVENEFRDTRPETTAQHAPAASTRPVLVANTNLQFGDVITEDDLARVDFPEAAIPFESFENVSDILGYDSAAAVNIIALTSIRKNEPILPHKISGPNGKGSLSARIRTGYRAASIRVDAVTGVSGFIVPGDIVDVIYTATPNASPLSSLSATAEVYRSDIILQSVQVLGIDQNQSDETSQADLAKTVTLEVNHNQAQLLLSAAAVTPATAETWVDKQSQTERVSAAVVKDDMVILRTQKAFKEIRVANAKIADVVVLSDRSFQVLGKAGGKTNVMLYDAQRRLIDIVDVNVGFDIAGLKKSLFETFPNERVEVRNLAGGLYLSGDVSTDAVYKRAEKIAQAFAPDRVTNGLDVKDSHQVMLQVRFVEASRDAIKELGINVLSQRNQGPSAGIDAGDFSVSAGSTLANAAIDGILGGGIGAAALDIQIQALEDKGVIRTLAEPNLVSMSGETASFLAGGEFPIPVPSGLGQIGIEYRKFGVGLAFTPTVLDDGVINLKVAPEVSQLDLASAVNIAGVSVPGLRVRRANTTIELRNSQSFAIAGLLQTTSSNDRNQVPWLSDVPILGSLFSSTRYQESETELVIIVTPYLAQPVSDISQLATPLDYLTKPSDFETFANGRLEGPELDPPTLSGSYGHAIQ